MADEPDDIQAEPGVNGKRYEIGYDEAEMGDAGVTPEAFDAAPKWEQDRISKIAYQRKQERESRIRAEAMLESEKAARSALEQRLAALEQTTNGLAQTVKPKEGIEAFSNDDLEGWLTRARAWQNRALADPNDADARAELQKIDPAKMSVVERELRKRTADEAVSRLRGEMEEAGKAANQSKMLKNRLRLKYGDEVEDMNSPLMKNAAVHYQRILNDFGWTRDENGAISAMAIEAASRELRKNSAGREMSGADHRRLAMEGAARKAASTANSISSLRSRGDWQSKVKASDLEIDAFLDSLGVPE